MTSDSMKHKDKMEKKKKTQKKKKSSKSKKVEDPHVHFGGSEDEMDLSRELYPIGYYINDREEMINQMFSVTKPERIRAMLPPILKNSSMEELKAYCLEELLGMSSRRIQSILEGQELETSSESEDLDSSSVGGSSVKSRKTNEEEEADGEYVVGLTVGGGDMDTLEIGITREEMGELLNCMPGSKERKRHSSTGEQELTASSNKKSKIKVKKSQENDTAKKTKKSVESEETKKSAPEENKQDDENNSDAPADTEESKGKTLLEILELEMRARAIRALLKQQGGEDEEIEEIDGSAASEGVKNSPLSVKESGNTEDQKTSAGKSSKKKLNKVTVAVPCSSNEEDVKNPSVVSGDSSQTNVKCKGEQSIPGAKVKRLVVEASVENESDDLYNVKDSCQEDGEKNSSSESVIEVQPEAPAIDVIVIDDSEDEKDENPSAEKSSSLQRSEDQCLDAPKSSSDPNPEASKSSSLSSPKRTDQNPDLSKSSSPQRSKEQVQETATEGSENKADSKPKSMNEEEKKPEANPAEVSWAGRWLQSEGVQKVVSTSKICAKIRKRMKLTQKMKKDQSSKSESSEKNQAVDTSTTAEKNQPVVTSTTNDQAVDTRTSAEKNQPVVTSTTNNQVVGTSTIDEKNQSVDANTTSEENQPADTSTTAESKK